jgi:cytochrome c oxidase assembly protein subunit 11
MRFSRSGGLGKYATLGGLVLTIAVMLTLVSYSVTLYRLFCQATGALGTTERVAAVSGPVSNRSVTVRFLTSTAPGLPWRFAPVQDSVRVRLGQDTLVFFEAENLSAEPIVGHATFNVTPETTGRYFKKIECFCFTEERLEPHQRVEMPVDFFVDAAMAADRNTADVTEIDLSYEFFRSLKPAGALDLARFEQAPPDPAAGQKIFDSACAACHGLDQAKVGPPLRGVFGRRAGAAPGYPYSAPLAQASLAWNADTLDRWLSGPQAFIPGAQMPVGLPDPLRRRNVIAYLKSLSQTAEAKPHPDH